MTSAGGQRRRTMKPLMLLRCVTLLTMFGTVGVVAHEQPGPAEALGQVHFPVSCNAAAQAQFDRAVARLHSFWFAPAIKTFTAVMALDPSCAMGHWGVAMSLLGKIGRAPCRERGEVA